jgi:hypothetical protein
MKKLHEKLAQLNTLRATLNQKPIAEWKGDAAELSEAILAAKSKIRTMKDESELPPEVKKIKVPTKVKKVTPSKVLKKIANSQKADLEEMKAETFNSFKDILAILRLDPKVARATLRKKFDDWKTVPLQDIYNALKK